MARNTRAREISCYLEEVPVISLAAQSLLIEWAGIPLKYIEQRIKFIREKAWKIFPYPYIGLFAFVEPYIAYHPIYPKVIRELQNSKQCRILDLGCGIGQNLYYLLYEGVESCNIVGLELDQRFPRLGQELYQGQLHKPLPVIISGDIFDRNSIDALFGTFDYVFAAAFFHLFGESRQLVAFEHAIDLLRPRAGSKLFGVQAGCSTAISVCGMPVTGGEMYIHSKASLTEVFRKITEKTGVVWVVEATLDESPEYRKFSQNFSEDKDGCKITFTITRM